MGAIAFFFTWQGSVYFVQRAMAIAIGMFVITTINYLVTYCSRHRYFKSFYRKKPAKANVYFLAMEWANFAVRCLPEFLMLRIIVFEGMLTLLLP